MTISIPELEAELDNFVDIFRRLRPPEPGLRHAGFELYGGSRYLNGTAGGDHLVYLDFDRRYDLDRRIENARRAGRDDVVTELERNRHRVGVLVADVAGHERTDALVAAMLHQAFLTGVLYELEMSGAVTSRLFDTLNTRFYNSVSFDRFITLIYGEIWDNGRFRFLSAGHPRPLVFSASYDRLAEVASRHLVSYLPLGMFPSEDDVDRRRLPPAPLETKRFSVNQIELMGSDDILLLYTDGLAELARDSEGFLPSRLEHVLRRVKHRPAQEIFDTVVAEAVAFAEPDDDLSLVVIKRF